MSAQLSFFDLSAGIHGRDEGILAVVRSNKTFVETARGIARIICRRKGVVCSDDVREVASEYGIEPESPNAYGAIFKTKEWRMVGWKQSEIPSNHGRSIRSWCLA